MSIIEEIEFERLEPTCCCCGEYLTFEEWELNGDVCGRCLSEEDDFYGT